MPPPFRRRAARRAGAAPDGRAERDSRGLFSDRAPDPAYAGLFFEPRAELASPSTAACWPGAADETLPVYERLKFLSIYCSESR